MPRTNPAIIEAEILEFYQALEQVHQKYREEITPMELRQNEKNNLSPKLPVLESLEIKFDPQQVKSAFLDICQVLSRHQPKVHEAVNRIESGVLQNETNIISLLKKFIGQDERFVKAFAKEHQLDDQLLSLVLFNIAKPFVTNYAKSLQEQYNSWQANNCPVCGWKPVLAVNSKEDNRRLLHCALCDTQWSFKSLACPYCLNEDHQTLKYFTAENHEAYQVNVCDKCKGYLKTVHEAKQMQRDSSFLINVKTLHLDILAQREGYFSFTP